MTLIEQNEMLAKFMGIVFVQEIGGNKYWNAPIGTFDMYNVSKGIFNYHKSWDWLMPVVEKLESMGFAIHIDEDTVYLHFPGNEKEMMDFTKEQFGSKITTVYKAVCAGVEWVTLKAKTI